MGQKHFLNWSFLAMASSAPKQSILEFDSIQKYPGPKSLLNEMQASPIHCGRFVPLGHILRLFISELRSF